MTNEELFNKNINLAYKNVQIYKNCGIEYEDLMQLCLYGLWKSVLTYKVEKGYAFSSYSYRIIQNEVNYYLRKNRKYFTDRYFSEPINDEITLEEIIADKHNQIEELENNLDSFNYINKIRNSNLKEKEKQVLELTLKGLKQRQIAEKIGLSQPQVSRIIKSFKKYRRKLWIKKHT